MVLDDGALPPAAYVEGVDYTLAYDNDTSSDLYGYTVLTVDSGCPVTSGITIPTIPEPGALTLMLALGVAGLAVRCRRRVSSPPDGNLST